MKILKEVRGSESLLILLEILFVWNNGSQKHSLSFAVILGDLRRFKATLGKFGQNFARLKAI